MQETTLALELCETRGKAICRPEGELNGPKIAAEHRGRNVMPDGERIVWSRRERLYNRLQGMVKVANHTRAVDCNQGRAEA